jgi:hypothetical protein
LAAFFGLDEAVRAFAAFRGFVLPADFVTEVALSCTALAPERTARPAAFIALSVSFGASNRATPAAATAPRTVRVIPMVCLPTFPRNATSHLRFSSDLS